MSKKNVSEDVVVEAAPVPNAKMAEEDRLALSLAKSRRETALAQVENADLNYRYTVLQLYMKYKMDANDALSEDGSIVKGGAVAAQVK